MPFHVDPREPVRREVGGITYHVRVFTQREVARFAVHSEALSAAMSGARDEGGVHRVHLQESDIERLERCLCLGLMGWDETDVLPEFRSADDGHMDPAMLDEVPFEDWMPLYAEILAANRVTEDDEKN